MSNSKIKEIDEIEEIEQVYYLECRDGQICIDKYIVEKSAILKNSFNTNYGFSKNIHRLNHSKLNVNNLIDYLYGRDLDENSYLGVYYIYDELLIEYNYFNKSNLIVMVPMNEYYKIKKKFINEQFKKFLQILHDNGEFLTLLYGNLVTYIVSGCELITIDKPSETNKNSLIVISEDEISEINYKKINCGPFISKNNLFSRPYNKYLNSKAFLSLEYHDDIFQTYLSYKGLDFYKDSFNEKFKLFKNNSGSSYFTLYNYGSFGIKEKEINVNKKIFYN